MMNDSAYNHELGESFLALHAQNHHRIAAFIHALVPNWQDAEELLQDTLVILWRKFGEFDRDGDFFAWAAQVAQYEILNYRRKNYRRMKLLDEEVLVSLAESAEVIAGDIDRRREALAECVKLLPERDRKIIHMRYNEHGNVETIATAIGRSVTHAHRLLRNIRGRLLQCVLRRISHI